MTPHHFSKSRESQRSSTSHKHATPVQLRPLGPFYGREEEQQTRLLVREETAGAAPVSTASFEGLVVSEGSTAVLHTAGDGALPSESTLSSFPGDPAVGCRSVKAEALVRPQPGEPLQPQPPARCNGTLHTPLLTVEAPGSTPGAGAIYQRSTSGIDEETVSKTAAPRKGVQSATACAIARHISRGAPLA